jgi:ribonuclease T1
MVTHLTPRGTASKSRQWLMHALCALAVGVAAFGPTTDALARRTPEFEADQSRLSVVPLTSLPRQAQEVHRLIYSGGPFPYTKDGVVFGNRERSLPRQTRGFYREYTVPTPGVRHRGARRIVCGGKEMRQPETCFYTGDHYNSFQRIDPRH